MVLSGVVASASLPEKSSSLSRHRDLESMLGVPASGLPLSSLDAARTRNDRRARDRRVRDTIAPPVRADATLAVPIGAVAVLSVHVMNLAARLLGSSDGLDTIYSGGMHCGTTRTTSGEARAGPRALECGSPAIVLATILSRSAHSGWLAAKGGGRLFGCDGWTSRQRTSSIVA